MDHRPSLLPPADADHYDDLSELERERHRNDMRLKNTFEHIFEKYSRDFFGIGDEIDLETGEIVVNNGHVAQIQDERDTGEGFDDWEAEEDADDNGLFGRYELGDSQEDDELLSSPPRNTRGRTFATGEPAIIHPSQSRNHFATPRNARPAAEPQRTPQRMDLANDPAFFQALGQSIAQGIAQYMTSYGNDTRPADPIWDAPPLPRPSHSVRRSTPQTQRRRPMVPESPRHPSSRSIWASGRPPGRPRVRPRSSTTVPAPSPSIRNNGTHRQMLASGSPERPRHPLAFADSIQYEDQDEAQDDGQDEYPDDCRVEYQDEAQDEYHIWAEDDDSMDFDHAVEPEIPARSPQATEIPRGRPARAEDYPPANKPEPTARDASAHKRPTKSLPTTLSSTSGASGSTREVDAAMRTEPAPQRPAKKAPSGRAGRTLVRDAPWSAEETELLIELREVRKASFPQCARYFPSRGPKNIENHYYKHLMNRPDKGRPRGEISEVVRRAIERGPILANKARLKPYSPKNPENAKPNRANLANPKELLQDTLPFVPDSESGSEALFSQERTATPPVQALPAQVTPQTPFSAAEEEGVYHTGDAKKPWACKRCGKAWCQKSGFKYHFAVPTRCKPPTTLHISQMVPAGVVPRGLDIQSGKPASFNPNILIREDVERTHLCIRCGKSWASHSNARQHTKHPEQCIPENWAINYDPAAHRKRRASDGLANPTGGQSSKRTKKDESATWQRLATAAQPLAEPSPLAAREDDGGRQFDYIPGGEEGVEPADATQWTPDTTPEPSSLSRRGAPKRFTISDKPRAQEPSEKAIPIDPALDSMFDTSKVLEVVQQHVNLPVQALGFSSQAPQRPQSSAVRQGNGESSSAGAAAVAGKSSGSSSKRMVQKTAARTATADPGRSSAKKTGTHYIHVQRTPPPQRSMQAVDLAGRPIGGPSPTIISKPEREEVPQRSASKAKAKAVEKLQKHDTPLKSSFHVTPGAKDVPVKASKAAKTQPARTAPKASSAQKPQSKVRATMTPQAKMSGEGARSSPLTRTVASEPRPRTSFADLLLDDSEDELAF